MTVDGRNPTLGLFPTRQMGHQGVEGVAIGKPPGPWQGDNRPIAQVLDQGQLGPRGVGGIGGDHELLAPGRAPKILQHVPKQRVFGLVVGLVYAPNEGENHRTPRDVPLGHEDDDPNAIDVGMAPAEARFLGYRMLEPPLPLEGAVAHQIEEAILRWGEGLQCLVGKPPQQRLRAPVGRAQQATIVLVGEGRRVGPGL